MKNLILFICLLSHMLLTNSANAQEANSITVVGKASIEQAPDQFSVFFTFEDRSYIVQKAKADVDQRVNLLLSQLKKMQIPDKAITATSVQIMPIYPRNNAGSPAVFIEQQKSDSERVISVNQSKKQQHKLTLLFDVSRRVEVKLTAIEQYEALLNQAVKIGVTRISPVQSSITNAEQLYQQALSQAVSNARTKAKRLAGNLGVNLGEVQTLNEHAYRAPGKIMMAREAMADSSMKNYTGVNQISAEVTVTFFLVR